MTTDILTRLLEEADHFEREAERKREAAEQAKIDEMQKRASKMLELYAPDLSLNRDELRAILGDFRARETTWASTQTFHPRIVLNSAVIPGLWVEFGIGMNESASICFQEQAADLLFSGYKGGEGRPAALRVILWAKRWNDLHPAMEEDQPSSLTPFESELS